MDQNASPLHGFDAAITTETSIENQGMRLAQVSGAEAGNRNGMPHLVNSYPDTNNNFSTTISPELNRARSGFALTTETLKQMNEKKAITKKALELGASYSKVYFQTVTFTDRARTKVKFLYFHNLKWDGANGWSELKKYAVVEHNVIIGSTDA